jgi:hypothetical protein
MSNDEYYLTDEEKARLALYKKLRAVSDYDLIATFKHQPKSELEKKMLKELVEMAIHKQQVASLLCNIYNKNYPCDLGFCLGYTRGGTYLYEAFMWLFEKCTSKEIDEVLSYDFINHIIQLHDLKPAYN